MRREEAVEVEFARSDAVQRTQPSPEHVVEPAIAAARLQRGEVARGLHDDEQLRIPRRIGADRTGILLGGRPAPRAGPDPRARIPDRVRQLERAGLGHAQEVAREPLGAAPTDARQALERFDEADQAGGR